MNEMGENTILITIGSIFGIIGTAVLAQPVWLLILSAFLTGLFLYLGKAVAIEIIKRIKKLKKS